VARACLREDEFIKDIYYGLQHMRFVLKSTTSGQASRRLKEWIDRFMFHPCGPLAKIAKAVIVRQREMENTILSPFSNGKIEGTNNKIKLIKRRAFGYRNLNNFFTRLKLELGSSK
ncbi:ISL3 family transposase, partial [Tetzosporium hominis]